ncbi:dienelactone hydrolase family protein [Thalassotalea psychrophila]|uniref:Dienelactone hydrolase family protein n=1 Tax=Thalassotalea psychrophila TaxID=3065647 RepID=A0ABY9TWH3_9GAMM|nr:dienelactone hydrolase family protein [Colwelliaceae bacterium SQ149]
MSIIIVSDVFGKTAELIKLSEELNANTIVDPYNGANMKFKSEAEAYSYFIETIGLDAYLAKLINVIESGFTGITLIGFSVGSSTIWRLSEMVSSHIVKRAVCFYGSQIRNFTSVDPLFDIELIFPKSEPHFSVASLQAELAKKQNVKAIKVDYLHGFMNYHSSNYNQAAYKEQINWLSTNASK